MPDKTEVLVVGAGPSGLVLALWLTRQGVRVRIIDKSEIIPSTSRALAIHARTVELYRQLDLADTLLENGFSMRNTNVWSEGVHRSQIALGEGGKDLTPYPFIHICSQDRHEKLLEEKLNALGVSVERQRELVDCTQHESGVTARWKILDSDEDKEEVIEAAFVSGCDGSHSTVRHSSGIEFAGAMYDQQFFVADIKGSGPTINGEANLAICQSEITLTFPFDDGHSIRLTGAVGDEIMAKQEKSELTLDDVAGHTIKTMNLQVDQVNWLTVYRIHHRVAEVFRKDRVFLVGDAAHIHSPVGGQGMNTGIGDAINLAWKLATVLRGHANMAFLDSYQAERQAFAQTLVQTTDRSFNVIASKSYVSGFVRSWFVPYIVPILARFDMFRCRAFSGMSQILLNYREGSLSAGSAGSVQGGDRVPWAPVEGCDNYDSLRGVTWQVHVYGSVSEALGEWCRAKDVPLHVFPWHQKYQAVGLGQDAAYLIRPDSYIAVAELDSQGFEEYFKRIGVSMVDRV